MEIKREFMPGDIVRHFKREFTGERDTRYLYRIIGVAEHSETGEKLMIYQALYDDYGIYARPYDMFISKVDHSKYPEIRQTYRFEVVRHAAVDATGAEEPDEQAAKTAEPADEPKGEPAGAVGRAADAGAAGTAIGPDAGPVGATGQSDEPSDEAQAGTEDASGAYSHYPDAEMDLSVYDPAAAETEAAQ